MLFRCPLRHNTQPCKEILQMTIRLAINGYGRIGRNILRALYEADRCQDFSIVAVNDLGDPATNAHLTLYDSIHGRFPGTVEADGDALVVNGDRIQVLRERDPSKLPWGELGIDLVLECTGLFTSGPKARAHLDAGAAKVLISAPATDVDATVVFGINQQTLNASHKIVSNASCTTNCLAALVQPLHREIGVLRGLMTTIHAFTNDQVLLDVYHSDLRRARATTASMIPTSTGAAKAVGLVLPELDGKLDGMAMRVPTINVSVVDLVFEAARDTSVEEIHSILKKASEGPLKGILAYNDQPLVSCDFNHDPHSSIYEESQTRVLEGRTAMVHSWYDNEWGFSNRMLDTAGVLAKI